MTEIDQIVAEQGWSQNTLADLAVEFIDLHGHTVAFKDYLRDVQRVENS